MNEAKNSATNSAEMVAIPLVKLDNLIAAAARLKVGKLRPFMYAIQGPDGEAHIDESCVAGDPAALAIEVNGLNDSPDAGYQIVPVYLGAQPVQQPAPVAEPHYEAGRKQGRAEALAILMQLDPECGIDEYTGWSTPAGPEDEGSAYWEEEKLRELFVADGALTDMMDKAEAQYWQYIGMQDEAERAKNFAANMHNSGKVREVLSKAGEFDLMGRLCSTAPVAAPVAGQEPVAAGWIQFVDGVQTQNFCRDEAELKLCRDLESIWAVGKNVTYQQVYTAPVPAASVQPEIERKLALNQVQIDGLHHEAERYKKLYQDLKMQPDSGRDAALVDGQAAIPEFFYGDEVTCCNEHGHIYTATVKKVEARWPADRKAYFYYHVAVPGHSKTLRIPSSEITPECRAARLAAHPANVAQPVSDAALLSAIRNGVPLEEPVSVAKAMMAKEKARVSLSGGTGPLATVFLVNIQAQPWTHTEETATAYADGFNRGVDWLRSSIIEYADKLPPASVAQAGELSDAQVTQAPKIT